MVLSMTHQVLVQKPSAQKLIYHGPSPDQLALVSFAHNQKYQFLDSSQQSISIKINETIKSFTILQTFSFSSQRKRMSILFRDGNKIKLYIKGADNIIKERLVKGQGIRLQNIVDQCSNVGLRTLIIALREVKEQEYREFKTNVAKLQGKQKELQYELLVSNLQTNLTLIGATAVEDKLQDLVPETIYDLLKADIKVWMLTGDKLETAENIAKSCNLIQKDFNIFRLSSECLPVLQSKLNQIQKRCQQLNLLKTPCALILQGPILSQILSCPTLSTQLLKTFSKCQSVVCSRLLPLQKAQIVSLIKSHSQKIVLSIGDGQNDVPMIRAANIGIGLYGQEGMGAVQASDYGLPEFRMLRRLLFVHGRYNYIRITNMILYFFYKNVIYTIPRFVFGFYSGFSSQRLFDDAYVALYNFAFTALPLIVRAVSQQDVTYVFETPNQLNGTQRCYKETIMNEHPQSHYLPPGYQINKYFYRLFPKIYFIGQQNSTFNKIRVFYWLFQALIIGSLLTWITFEVMDTTSTTSQGHNTTTWMISLNLFTSLLFIVTAKLVMHTKYMSIYFIVSMIGTLGFYIGYMWFSNHVALLTINMLGITQIIFQNTKSWFLIIFGVCLIVFIDGIGVTIDFYYGKQASKMRMAVSDNKHMSKEYLRQLELPISESQQQNTIHEGGSEVRVNNDMAIILKTN